MEATDGRFRRLTPVEMERLNGFPDNWTEGITDGRRAFLMGNALVVGIVARISSVLEDEFRFTKLSDVPYRVSESVTVAYSA